MSDADRPTLEALLDLHEAEVERRRLALAEASARQEAAESVRDQRAAAAERARQALDDEREHTLRAAERGITGREVAEAVARAADLEGRVAALERELAATEEHLRLESARLDEARDALGAALAQREAIRLRVDALSKQARRADDRLADEEAESLATRSRPRWPGAGRGPDRRS